MGVPNRIYLKAYKERTRFLPTQHVSSYDFTFPINPRSIKRTSQTEWRIRHIGLTAYPHYRWRERETTKVKLEGTLYMDEGIQNWNGGKGLMALVNQAKRRTLGYGVVFKMYYAEPFGVVPEEFWCFCSPLAIVPTKSGRYVDTTFSTPTNGEIGQSTKTIWVPMVNYNVDLQLVYKQSGDSLYE